MAKTSYEEQAQNLAKATDIAIVAFKQYPPKDFTQAHIDHMVKTYLEFKNDALNPELQYKKIASLKYVVEAVFTYFQEAGGKTVDFFWEEIKKQNLPYQRENKLAKILKRGKIKNRIEYDFIIDVIVPYKQEGIITEDEFMVMNKLISNFENKK